MKFNIWKCQVSLQIHKIWTSHDVGGSSPNPPGFNQRERRGGCTAWAWRKRAVNHYLQRWAAVDHYHWPPLLEIGCHRWGWCCFLLFFSLFTGAPSRFFQIPFLFTFIISSSSSFSRYIHHQCLFFSWFDEPGRMRRLRAVVGKNEEGGASEECRRRNVSLDLTWSRRKLWRLHGLSLGRRGGGEKWFHPIIAHQTIEFRIQVLPLIPEVSSPYSIPFLFSHHTNFNCKTLKQLHFHTLAIISQSIENERWF